LKKFKTHDITIYPFHPGFFLSAVCIDKTGKILIPKNIFYEQ